MFAKLLQPFSSATIHTIVEHFYEIYKLCLVFALFSSPWLGLNMLLKFSPTTSIVYGLIGSMLLPSIQALLTGIDHIYKLPTATGFRYHWRLFLKTWHQQTLRKMLFQFLLSIVLIVYCDEFYLIAKVVTLHFMMIPFLIIGAFLLATVLNYLLISAWSVKELSEGQHLYLASYLSWRNILTASVLAIVVLLWLSMGYHAPILNVLFGNIVTFWLIYKFRFKAVNKIMCAVSIGKD